MSFIDSIPRNKVREFARDQYDKVHARDKIISELRSEVDKLKKQLGIQEDGFIDTPSLNRVMFNLSGQPCCSEHGAMNQYEYKIYRCVMCGVAIQLDTPYSVLETKKRTE